MGVPGEDPYGCAIEGSTLGRDLRPGQTRREAETQSQGSDAGIDRQADRPVAGGHGAVLRLEGEQSVKANLARFTWAVAMLAAMALSVGAWMRW